ncbi:MAG: lipoate--protein ligase family protein [Candidatus Tectomicrobia bacterium]|nr:lipoate--protein ligase family protein [Candidatus Tectomicrobia bacterium]
MRAPALPEPRRPPGRFLDTGAAPAAWNMAVDEVLLDACRAGLSGPRASEGLGAALRVYAWSPPALSLGRGQSAGRDVRLEVLEREGIGLCRRLTGGRAVLHDRELTYSLTGPEALLGRSIGETYRRVSEGLLVGLRRLGVPAGLASPAAPRAGGAYASHGSCFATASVWELAAGGRKVVGSAQCRAGGAVLQHGSVLLRCQEERLAALLRPRGKGGVPVRPYAVGIEEILGREVAFRELAAALREGLEGALGMAFREAALTPAERARAEALARERYGNPAWTLAR